MSISRREFLKLSGAAGIDLFLETSGLAALLASCGRKEQPQLVSLSGVIENPEIYFKENGEGQTLSVVGYPVFTAREKRSVPVTRVQMVGKTPIIFIDWITVTVDLYQVREGHESDSPSLLAIDKNMLYSVGAPVSPGQTSILPEALYEVVGRMTKIKPEGSNIEEYALEIERMEKLASE